MREYALQTTDGSVGVWMFDANHEAHLRKTLGESKYQELCQKFGNVGKSTRARFLAMETGLAIPEPMETILRRLTNRPVTKS
jgi:hypothetical protein